MRKMVGLTGGIGSGKSAATGYFAQLGVAVVDADQVAREVVEPGTPALEKIYARFGRAVLHADGSLDRGYLREVIFADTTEQQGSGHKQWLESLLHPLIRESIVQQLGGITSTYGILASPLLFETEQDELVDVTLVIDCPEALQLARAQQRDGVSVEQIERIMASQLPREVRRQRGDEVIDNSGSLEDLHRALEGFHQWCLVKFEGS